MFKPWTIRFQSPTISDTIPAGSSMNKTDMPNLTQEEELGEHLQKHFLKAEQMKRKPTEFEEKVETMWGQEDIQEETLGSHIRWGGTWRNKEGTSHNGRTRGALKQKEGRKKKSSRKGWTEEREIWWNKTIHPEWVKGPNSCPSRDEEATMEEVWLVAASGLGTVLERGTRGTKFGSAVLKIWQGWSTE